MTPRTPNQRKRYKALGKRLNKYAVAVSSAYDNIIDSAVDIAYDDLDEDEEYSFDDNEDSKGKAALLWPLLASALLALSVRSIRDEWSNSNKAQDLLADDLTKAYGIKKNGQWYKDNESSREQFIKRSDQNGTIWQKYLLQSKLFSKEVESAISAAYSKGVSKELFAARTKRLVSDFGRLTSTYRDKFGHAPECVNVLPSSVRLAKSEANIAYRRAEQERWRQIGVIKAYRIQTSSTLHEKEDMCDELAGIYPIDFLWVGWHPNCKCFAVPIVATLEEEESGDFDRVTDVPIHFYKWLAKNAPQISRWKSTPYFLADNPQYSGILQVMHELKPSKDEYIDIPTKQGQVRIHTRHGKEERAKNISIAMYLANRYGYKIDLLPTKTGKKTADTYNHTLKKKQEYKTGETATMNAIDRLIREGRQQAGSIVIRIDIDIPLEDLSTVTKKRVIREGNIYDITFIIKEKDATFTRQQILDNSFKIKREDFS